MEQDGAHTLMGKGHQSLRRWFAGFKAAEIRSFAPKQQPHSQVRQTRNPGVLWSPPAPGRHHEVKSRVHSSAAPRPWAAFLSDAEGAPKFKSGPSENSRNKLAFFLGS